MFNTYDKGDLIRLEISETISGSSVNPDYLALYVTRPDKVVEQFIYGLTGTFIQLSTGNYYLDYFASQYGQYVYRFFSSGTAWGAESKRFVIRRE